MTRCWCAWGAILSIVLLFGPHPRLDVCTATFGQSVTQDAKAALEERNRLWSQTQKLRGEGKLGEAITAATAMLAIERKLLPADHADLVLSLNWLADLYLAREDFASAKAVRADALVLNQLEME
jgi:hypothetical protein